MVTLRDQEPYSAMTGATHAATFASTAGEIPCTREDVGCHNALDKLISAMVRKWWSAAAGFALLSSRCSYELAQEAAAYGVRLLCTAGQPGCRTHARAGTGRARAAIELFQ